MKMAQLKTFGKHMGIGVFMFQSSAALGCAKCTRTCVLKADRAHSHLNFENPAFGRGRRAKLLSGVRGGVAASSGSAVRDPKQLNSLKLRVFFIDK